MEKRTTTEKHEKHPLLIKPSLGHYHRNEWAVYGTKCTKIKEFYEKLAQSLSSSYRIGYIDADHGIEKGFTDIQIGIKHFYIKDPLAWNEYDDKSGILHSDGVIVNGNHYPASSQIVIIDDDKKESLKRRKDQLTNIKILVTPTRDSEIYDFLNPLINPGTTRFTLEEMDQIALVIKTSIDKNIPKLKALILAGGKSKRMGKDKSLITYHDKPQQIYLAEMCRTMGMETYISKAAGYTSEKIGEFQVIKDRLIDMGPFGAIVSAMMADPDAAWLILACDLPYLDIPFMENLLKHRDHRYFATAAKSKSKPFPEPLVAIYEPSIYPRMLSFMALGYSCPRKVLINSDINVLEIEEDNFIDNVNTPEESMAAINSLKGRH